VPTQKSWKPLVYRPFILTEGVQSICIYCWHTGHVYRLPAQTAGVQVIHTYRLCTFYLYILQVYSLSVHTAGVQAVCTYCSCTGHPYISLVYRPSVYISGVQAICIYRWCTSRLYILLVYGHLRLFVITNPASAYRHCGKS